MNEATAQYFAWRGASLAVPALPSPVDPLLARGLGAVAYAAAPNARAAVRANLSVVAPGLGSAERETLVRRAFVNQARNYLTTLRLPQMRRDHRAGRVVVNGWNHVERARTAGAGIVFASAHFGPLPHVGALALAAHDLQVAVVAEAISPKLFELLNRNLRGASRSSPIGRSPATACGSSSSDVQRCYRSVISRSRRAAAPPSCRFSLFRARRRRPTLAPR